MKLHLHAYQRRALAFVMGQACAGLLLDPGLGKTIIMLEAFKLLKARGMARKMLVITPLRPMYLTWPAEVAKWDEVRDLKAGVLHGPMKSATLNDPDVDVHVINPEGLKWLFATVENPEEYWDILCVDESTRFKHTDTDRFRFIKPHLEKFGRRYILTGSPAPNGLLDLFGQIYLLDLGNTLGRFITWYRTAYFDKDFTGFKYTPKPDAEKRIYEKLAPLVLRMDARDYLDLPPLIGACGFGEPLVHPVELPEAAMRVYKRMEEAMIVELEGEAVTAASAAAVSGKCRQIANGGMYGAVAHDARYKPGGKYIAAGDRSSYGLHEVKLDAVEEIVEELQGTPCIVAYEFHHELERLKKRFPDAPHVGGGVTPARFRAVEQAWNRGEVPVLLAQPQSVAHGLNLQATKAAVIWHSLTWDLEVYEQFIRRVWRQGQKEKVIVHHIIAKDTIDEVVLKMLQKKDKTQRDLLAALKESYL